MIQKENFSYLENLSIDEKIKEINRLKLLIREFSPFKNEPVDSVIWVKGDRVIANDYNPNKVAPPEMELLEVSIDNDGYTQPIVTFPNEDNFEIIDGFHRNRVGKESKKIRERIFGYLPIVPIRKDAEDKNHRIASTIRHNRARGKHQIDAMSEIILELKNRNWKNSRIARELGMDEDEILRLCQITGLEDLFSDNDFSKSWNAEDFSEEDFEELSEEKISEEDLNNTRIPNEKDENRIFHKFDKWECYKAGFYESSKEGMTHEQCELMYPKILSDENKFSEILEKVIKEWKYSCEHYLTNKAMNRIAWLGQASVCYETGVPSRYSSGWNLLSQEQQEKANDVALKYLNKWLKQNGRDEIEMSEAISEGRQVEIY